MVRCGAWPVPNVCCGSVPARLCEHKRGDVHGPGRNSVHCCNRDDIQSLQSRLDTGTSVTGNGRQPNMPLQPTSGVGTCSINSAPDRLRTAQGPHRCGPGSIADDWVYASTVSGAAN